MNSRPDSLGMQEATLDLPDQIERSVVEARQLNGLPNASAIDQVVDHADQRHQHNAGIPDR